GSVFFSTALPRERMSALRTVSVSPLVALTSTTFIPARAAHSAIPRPIPPVPTIPMVSLMGRASFSCSQLCESLDALNDLLERRLLAEDSPHPQGGQARSIFGWDHPAHHDGNGNPRLLHGGKCPFGQRLMRTRQHRQADHVARLLDGGVDNG